jgi:hypothetical protein
MKLPYGWKMLYLKKYIFKKAKKESVHWRIDGLCNTSVEAHSLCLEAMRVF